MLMTGLVSLNVHEALTFEGTEICLHPDLFAPSTADANTVAGGSSANTRHSVLGGGGGSSSKDGRLSLVATASSEDKMSTTAASVVSQSTTAATAANANATATATPRLLQAGDMVEIRVWDPLPRSQQTHHRRTSNNNNNAQSVLRKRSSPPMSSQSSASGSIAPEERQAAAGAGTTAAATTTTTTTTTTNTSEALEADASSLKSGTTPSKTTAASEVASLQYSEFSLPPSSLETMVANNNSNNNNNTAVDTLAGILPENLSRDLDALTVSSDEPLLVPDVVTPLPSPGQHPLSPGGDDNALKTVITSGELPPVFPRSRANTADAGPTNSNNNSNNTAPRTTSTITGTKPPMAQRRQSTQKSRHQRELSDMTVDTVYGLDPTRATPLDNTHNLLDMQLPLAHFEEQDHDNNNNDEDETDNNDISNFNSLRLSFVMKVTEKSLTSLKGSGRTQVSLLRQVADLYELKNYDMVTIHKLVKNEEAAVLRAVSADFVLVTIKDQFISRGDMHYFQQTLIGSWIYEGQRLSEPARGFQGNAWEIRHGDHQARSGIVTDETMFAFRSRSARIFWLVQMSAEMWDYASPYDRDQDESVCELYFDKWISFIHELFGKWKELEATHSLTVVFFSRTFLSSGQVFHDSEDSPLDEKDVYGRRYEDHCRVVIESETNADWNSLVVRIKKAFLNYPREVGWKLPTSESMRRPSKASQGNVLEAINVTLNLLQFHYLDRDLHRTGNSIVVVSAGNGVFEVDKGLASITYQRMMDNGIGSDMLSLGLPPLHIAPFFLYVNDYQSVETDGIDVGETYYEVPHWMHLSFVSYESDNALLGDRSSSGEAKPDPRSRIISTGLDVAPNGFLLPASSERSPATFEPSPSLGPAPSFSLVGNAAASPIKKSKALTQERQLISGRDFRDILEACRPRHAGLLPSALKALLTSPGKQDRYHLSREAKEREEGEESELAEWGALKFEEKVESSRRVGKKSLLGVEDPDNRPSTLLGSLARATSPSSGQLAQSPSRFDICGRSSPTSSYGSPSVLGVSYDRPFLAQQASPTLSGIQLQRAPSLEIEYDNDNDSENALSDDGSVDVGLDTGDSSIEAGIENESGKQTSDSFSRRLTTIMKAYDSQMFAAQVSSSPNINACTDLNKSQHGEVHSARLGRGSATTPAPGRVALSQQLRSPARTGMAGGGIGAALNQYSGTTSAGNQVDDIDFEGGRLTRGNSMLPGIGRYQAHPEFDGGKRITRGNSALLLASSQGRLQIPEMTSLSFSPMLLPPVSAEPLGPGGASRLPVRTLDRSRLVHPHELLSRQGQDKSLGPLMTGFSATGRSEVRSGAQSSGRGTSSERGLSTSPPRSGLAFAGSLKRSEAVTVQHRRAGRDHGNHRTQNSRRKKAFNPFRQQDEDEVLAKKSHNRRRWSHVFPLGEIEFKRHAGPNWKSLSSPAILPLSVDYFPPQQEIDHNYTFSIFNVTLSEFEKTHYSSNKDLLMEMVRQRLTQDYQLVPPSHVNASNYRRESLRDGLANRGQVRSIRDENDNVDRQFLSMGHRLQVLTYDSTSDIVEVTRYNSKDAQHDTAANSFKYYYLGLCQETNKFTKVVQTFNKYSDQYNWSKVDRIICGDDDREMREGMRSRRIMFGLVPPVFENVGAEQEYITKFIRLLEYLTKLKGKDESSGDLDIKIVSSADKEGKTTDNLSSPGISRNNMKRFYVQLRKGKRDLFEWMEVALDSTFDTSWSYRIIMNWLVASSGKVDAQVQLLQRRCNQYGLNLVPFPQITVSKDLYLNPFKAPAIFTVLDKFKASQLGKALLERDFVHDGVFSTDTKPLIDCIDNGSDFDFGKRWSMAALGRQYVHRSGTLFVRHLVDRKGWVILVSFGNYRYIAKAEATKDIARAAFDDLTQCVDSLTAETEEES